MITAAVICEYNPFHTGHEYQLKKIREELNADRIICLMSGDYVQRGEPALLSKEIRANMALNSGADLVLLLPVSFATGAADVFSYGAVSILNRLGMVDYLCFGAECPNIEELLEVNRLINDVCSVSSPQMQKLLKEGFTFAGARAELLPECSHILNGSNNVLALEYLNALEKTNSSIKPFLIKREGKAYNDETIDINERFQSASAIRKKLSCEDMTDVVNFIPDCSKALLNPDMFVFPKDFDEILLYSLLYSKDLSRFSDCSQDLINRIKNNLPGYTGFENFSESLKTKNYTQVRIKRALLHIVLNIKGSNSELKEQIDRISSVRVLGFSKNAVDLVSEISEKGEIRLLTKIPDVYSELSDVDKEMVDLEENASCLYDKVLSCKNGKVSSPEYSKKLIIIQ